MNFIKRIFVVSSNSFGVLALLMVALLLLSGCKDKNPAAALPNPVAAFLWSGRAVVPATITFENQSEYADEFVWDFGDGTRSDEANPVHIYTAPNSYAVTLRSIQTNSGLFAISSESITIMLEPPIVNFTWWGDTIAPATIRFQNLSRNADIFTWDFGDGGSSANYNPVHVFQGAGTYTVTLTARQSTSVQSRSLSKPISIANRTPHADFYWTGEPFVDSTITFHNTSLNADESGFPRHRFIEIVPRLSGNILR